MNLKSALYSGLAAVTLTAALHGEVRCVNGRQGVGVLVDNVEGEINTYIGYSLTSAGIMYATRSMSKIEDKSIMFFERNDDNGAEVDYIVAIDHKKERFQVVDRERDFKREQESFLSADKLLHEAEIPLLDAISGCLKLREQPGEKDLADYFLK